MSPILYNLNSGCELPSLEILDLKYMRPWDSWGRSQRWVQIRSLLEGIDMFGPDGYRGIRGTRSSCLSPATPWIWRVRLPVSRDEGYCLPWDGTLRSVNIPVQIGSEANVWYQSLARGVRSGMGWHMFPDRGLKIQSFRSLSPWKPSDAGFFICLKTLPCLIIWVII